MFWKSGTAPLKQLATEVQMHQPITPPHADPTQEPTYHSVTRLSLGDSASRNDHMMTTKHIVMQCLSDVLTYKHCTQARRANTCVLGESRLQQPSQQSRTPLQGPTLEVHTSMAQSALANKKPHSEFGKAGKGGFFSPTAHADGSICPSLPSLSAPLRPSDRQ